MQVVVTPQPEGSSAPFHVESDTVSTLNEETGVREGERELADHIVQVLETAGVESVVITRYDE